MLIDTVQEIIDRISEPCIPYALSYLDLGELEEILR